MGCGRSKIVDNSGNTPNKEVAKLVLTTPGITFNEKGTNIIARYKIKQSTFDSIDS